jgi:WD40 repeat protein
MAVNLPGNCILTGGEDKAVKIWNLNPLGNLQMTVPTPGPVTRIAMDANGPVFMWAVEELLRPPDVSVGCVYHLDSNTMQTSRVAGLARFPGDAAFTHPRAIMSFVILMQGVGGQPTLITGGGEGDIAVWVHEGGNFVRKNRLEGHSREVSSLVVVGGLLWSASYDQTVRIWDLNTMQPLRVISTETCPGELSDGRPIAHYDKVTSLAVITQPSIPDPANPTAAAMVTYVASGSMDGTVKLMNDSGEIQGSWDHGETGKVCSLEFMSNIAGNRCLLIGLENGNIVVRTTATFNILFILDRQVCNTGPILSLKAVQTPTGQEGSDPTAVFASGSADGQLILWQVEKAYIADVAVAY